MIVMKITTASGDVKGGVKLAALEEGIELEALQFGASKMVHHSEAKAEASRPEVSSINVSLPMGPWVPVLLDMLYKGQNLDKVEFTELKQEGNAGGEMKKRRVVTVTDAHVESLMQGWSGIHSNVSMSIQFTTIKYDWADKSAAFDRTQVKAK